MSSPDYWDKIHGFLGLFLLALNFPFILSLSLALSFCICLSFSLSLTVPLSVSVCFCMFLSFFVCQSVCLSSSFFPAAPYSVQFSPTVSRIPASTQPAAVQPSMQSSILPSIEICLLFDRPSISLTKATLHGRGVTIITQLFKQAFCAKSMICYSNLVLTWFWYSLCIIDTGRKEPINYNTDLYLCSGCQLCDSIHADCRIIFEHKIIVRYSHQLLTLAI